MNLEQYKRTRSAIAAAIGIAAAYSIVLNSILTLTIAVAVGMVAMYILGRGLTEVERDERTTLIRSKAASATLAVTTVAMAVTGISLAILGRQGIGGYEEIGYLLAYQACAILILNSLLNYYYAKRMGG